MLPIFIAVLIASLPSPIATPGAAPRTVAPRGNLAAVPYEARADIGTVRCGDRRTIKVILENSSNFEKHWIVKDARTGKIVLDEVVEGRGTVEVELAASGAGYGEVIYRHAGREIWSLKSFLSDGQTVPLY